MRKTKYIFLDIFTGVILSCKIDVFRFTEGFNTLGLLQDIRAHPDLFPNLFVEDVEPLKAADLSAVFQVNFSTPGTHKREIESQTICFWRDWLIDVEGTRNYYYKVCFVRYYT